MHLLHTHTLRKACTKITIQLYSRYLLKFYDNTPNFLTAFTFRIYILNNLIQEKYPNNYMDIID